MNNIAMAKQSAAQEMPVELIQTICLSVPERDLPSCCLVNRTWNKAATDELWTRHLFHIPGPDFDKALDALTKQKRHDFLRRITRVSFRTPRWLMDPGKLEHLVNTVEACNMRHLEYLNIHLDWDEATIGLTKRGVTFLETLGKAVFDLRGSRLHELRLGGRWLSALNNHDLEMVSTLQCNDFRSRREQHMLT